MNERDLHILCKLASEKNITKTAEKLFISQPTLTYRLQQLEKRFDLKIINRENKGVTFTPEGEMVLKFAQNTLQLLTDLEEHLSNMQKGIKGTLRLGVASAFARYRLPEILKSFSAKFPDVEIKLKTGHSHDIHQLIKNKGVHLAILRHDYEWPGEKYLVDKEDIYLTSVQKVNFEQLPVLPRILYNTDISFQKKMDNWWTDHFNTPPKTTLEVDRYDTCEKMVTNGLGYALLPDICLEDKNLHREQLFFKDGTPLSTETWLIYEKHTEDLKVVKAFLDFFKKSNNYSKNIIAKK